MKVFSRRKIQVVFAVVFLLVASAGVYFSARGAANVLVYDSLYSAAEAASYRGPYWVDVDVGAMVFVDINRDIHVRKTNDGGDTWSTAFTVAGDVLAISAWFDRENVGDTTGAKLHIAWMDLGSGGTAYYKNYDISTDTAGTTRTISTGNGASSVVHFIGITKSVAGNLIVAHVPISDGGAYKSSDEFATAPTAITNVLTVGGYDHHTLYPAMTSDDNDVVMLRHDHSAGNSKVSMYDDSANTWTESSLDGSISSEYDRWRVDGAVRHSDGHILVALSDRAADAIQLIDVTPDSIASPTVTVKTSALTGAAQADDAAVMINQQNDDIYVCYTNGAAWESTVNAYFNKSSDGGSTWEGETAYGGDSDSDYRGCSSGRSVTSSGGNIMFSFFQR